MISQNILYLDIETVPTDEALAEMPTQSIAAERERGTILAALRADNANLGEDIPTEINSAEQMPQVD